MYAIELKNISKKYNLINSRPLLIKSFLSKKPQEKWALKNISLNIKKGETIGIIGKNGSGKSTLLKIISGITTPTSGSIKINGKVASLIELGAGFHADLTGKENIYLNGTLLGLTKKDIDKQYREIVEFANIGEYLNQPIRIYSSGMVVRLGFSVAIHLDPDILLIDEVFAVGDEIFQKKCFKIIDEFKKKKKTIFLISHNLSLIQNICTKTFIIDQGKIKEYTSTKSAVRDYVLKTNDKLPQLIRKRWGSGEARIMKVILFSENKKNLFYPNDLIKIILTIRFSKRVQSPIFGIVIRDIHYFEVFSTNTKILGVKTGNFFENEIRKVEFTIGKVLLPGKYFISPAIASNDLSTFYDWQDNNLQFTIKQERTQTIVQIN